MDTRQQLPIDEDADEMLTSTEFMEILVGIHDLALSLLAQQGKVTPKIIRDQVEFTEKMVALLEEDIATFSSEHVASVLPDNSWLEVYRQAIPLIETYMGQEEVQTSYNS